MNAFLLKSLGRANAFPCAGDLDQDPFFRNAMFFEEADKVSPFLNRCMLIETQPRIDFD